MQTLRNKVFRRVKTKQLHGRMLTGQMFLELCQAYSDSINKGSVPSINSAWTNLCQNENLRSIQEAIASYESQMTQQIYDPAQTSSPKTPTVDYDGLKRAHKEALNDAIETFKTKAFGDNI